MKGLKITNIILFSIICAIEVAILGLFVNCTILLFSGNVAGILTSILFFIPYYAMGVGFLTILSIIITITTHKKIDLQVQNGLTKTKFDNICKSLPWLFVSLSIILFLSFIIISNVIHK